MCKVKKGGGIIQIHLSVKNGNISTTESFYVACFTFVQDNCLS